MLRLLQEGEVDPQYVVLAGRGVTGELGADIARLGGMWAEVGPGGPGGPGARGRAGAAGGRERVTLTEPLDGDLRPVHGRYRGVPTAAFAGAA